jgi:hypothetical protein
MVVVVVAAAAAVVVVVVVYENVMIFNLVNPTTTII